MSERNAFINFNLPPFGVRRDIAMLGVIHKCSLGLTHDALCSLFPPAIRSHSYNTRFSNGLHNLQRLDRCDGRQNDILQRSAFGLVRMYNLLPQKIIDMKDISLFQRALQNIVKSRCEARTPFWQLTFRRNVDIMHSRL